MTIANDAFTVFISHKHEDHALAVVVKEAIQSLNKDLIDCFVSGVDITAGTDWRREIRSGLGDLGSGCKFIQVVSPRYVRQGLKDLDLGSGDLE